MAGESHPPETNLVGRLTDHATRVLSVSPPTEFTASLLVALHENRLDVPTDVSAADTGDIRPVREESVKEDDVVKLLIDQDDIDSLFDTFYISTIATDLIASGHLRIRTVDTLDQRLTMTDDEAFAHVCVADSVMSLDAESDSFRSSLREEYEDMWSSARPFTPDVPALSRLLATFADGFPEAAETFAAVIGSDEPIQRSGDFDPITVIGLIAARHELQTLEVSDWAEEIDLSSRTEISRVKSRLSNREVVDTDRVPHGVGRPRQKLVVADDVLAECDPESLVSEARRLYEADTREPNEPSAAVGRSAGADS
jgi:propanediol utilization protein